MRVTTLALTRAECAKLLRRLDVGSRVTSRSVDAKSVRMLDSFMVHFRNTPNVLRHMKSTPHVTALKTVVPTAEHEHPWFTGAMAHARAADVQLGLTRSYAEDLEAEVRAIKLMLTGQRSLTKHRPSIRSFPYSDMMEERDAVVSYLDKATQIAWEEEVRRILDGNCVRWYLAKREGFPNAQEPSHSYVWTRDLSKAHSFDGATDRDINYLRALLECEGCGISEGESLDPRAQWTDPTFDQIDAANHVWGFMIETRDENFEVGQ